MWRLLLCACLGLASCGAFETQEVWTLRQADSSDGGAGDGGVLGCSGTLGCGIGEVCFNSVCVPVANADAGADAGLSSVLCAVASGTGVVCNGTPGLQLGWSVSLCDAETFAAGAPGGSVVLRYENYAPTWSPVPTTRAGQSVLCRADASTLAGGPTGLFEVGLDGAVEPLWDYAGFALASFNDVAQQSVAPLATAKLSSGDRAVLRLTANGFTSTLAGAEPFGDSLATSPDGLAPLIAVGAPLATSGGVMTLERADSSGTSFTVADQRTDLAARAGVAVAIGDVWPDRPGNAGPDNEVLVASETSVMIFRADLTPVRKYVFGTTIGSVAGPPVAVVVDDTPLVHGSTLHVFYVGHPATNSVLRCLGAHCETWKTGAAGSDFGAALAQHGDSVLIGAPAANTGAGAVYLVPREQLSLTGEAQACDDEQPCCTSAEVGGLCVGGVFCRIDSSGPPAACVSAPDAGAPDAGDDGDAGIPDSGTPDAGPPDAGIDGGTGDATPPVELSARGCSTAPGAWAVLLALALRRRGRARS